MTDGRLPCPVDVTPAAVSSLACALAWDCDRVVLERLAERLGGVVDLEALKGRLTAVHHGGWVTYCLDGEALVRMGSVRMDWEPEARRVTATRAVEVLR